MSKTREVKIGDLFIIERGNGKYTRGYAETRPGKIPIYSAALGAPLAFTDSSDYTGPLLTVTTNGYGGTVQVINGDFTCNGDRAVLLPRDGVVMPDLRYLARVLEQALRPLAVGRRGDVGRNEYTKLEPKRINGATIPLLVDALGNDDYTAMNRIGEAMARADDLQTNLRSRIEQLKCVNIVLDAGASVDLQLGDTSRFALSIGKRVLRTQLDDTGDVPVYSANARIPMGYVKAPRLGDKFTAASLIWGIDGDFDWNLIPAHQAFVPTDHCGRLQVLADDIDPEYLLYALRATKDSHGFDRVFRAKLANIAELSVPVPVDETGVPDIARQRALAARYRHLDIIREQLLQKVSSLTSVVVVPH